MQTMMYLRLRYSKMHTLFNVFMFTIFGVGVMLFVHYIPHVDVWRKYYVNTDFNTEICMNFVACDPRDTHTHIHTVFNDEISGILR